MNVSDSYMWIFFFSAQLIPMMNPVLCSYLMEFDMENFVYMNITSTVLGLFCLPLMVYVYRNLRSRGVLKVKAECLGFDKLHNSNLGTKWRQFEYSSAQQQG